MPQTIHIDVLEFILKHNVNVCCKYNYKLGKYLSQTKYEQ